MKKKTYLYILILIFAASLIPMYIIGIYDHPSVDDYYYGVDTARIWQETGSLSAVIRESFSQMITTYHDWQGNFSAIFLMRLQPGIFGESMYTIAPFLLITTFAAAMLGFFYCFLRKWFHAGRLASIVTAICVTFAAIQFTYVPSDSFYWYNGSIYYTFFFSLMLVLFILVTITIRTSRRVPKAICFILAAALAFIIGGGNYSTALFTTIILVLMVLWYILRKRKVSIPLLTIMLCSLLGLGISIVAPGNAIRQEAVGGSTGIIKALLYSFAYGGYNIASSTTAPAVALWVILLPVFYRIGRNSGFRFRYPLLVLLFSYAVYCSQGTPVFYAQGLRMPYRMMNIIYFTYYIFMTFNLIYLMGWLGNHWGHTPVMTAFERIYDNARHRAIYIVAVAAVFAVTVIGLIRVGEAEYGSPSFSGLTTSMSAAYSLINGEAAVYDTEINDRVELLTTTDEMNVVLEPLSATPYTIFHTDITTDPLHWKNAHMALYYGKASVRLDE